MRHSWPGPGTVIAACGLLIAGQAQAGAVTDGSLGPVQSLSGDMTIAQDLGTAVGSNLFHSFSTFGIDAGESATFTAVDPFTNVISRVTGGAPSGIDGPLISTVLNSDGGGADLWLVNPAGIVFGANASLQVPGAFHASTADYLKLGDCGTAPGSCGQFNATNPEGSTLAVASPASFGFLGPTAGGIELDGANLQVPLYASISLTGGNINAAGGGLYANSGTVDITSVAGPGEIGIDPADVAASTVTQFGNLSLSGANLLTDQIAGFTSGGRIFIRGGAVVIDASTITSNHAGTGTGGGIFLTGTDSIALSSGATVRIANAGTGSAGTISLNGGDISLADGSTVVSSANGAASGPAIDLSGADIRMTGGGTVYSTGIGGDAGDITTTATGSIMIDGAGEGQTGIVSAVLPGTSRNAGSVRVQTGDALSLLAGGVIGSQTAGAGSAGQLNVTATTMVIDGTGAPQSFTGITSQAVSGATGISSAVTVDVDSMIILGGGEITSDTFAAGAAGRVSVTVGDLLIDGTAAAPGRFTGISAGSEGGATGNAGAVLVQGNSLTVLGSGAIATNTSGSGMAGDVTLSAETIVVSGPGSGISSASSGTGPGAGKAGNVALTAGTLTLAQGGQVAATTVDGAGGAVTLRADLIGITDGARVNVATSGSGAAGDVLISGPGSTAGNPMRSGSVTVSGEGSGIISDTSGTGDGGAVTVVASSLQVSDGASISAASEATSGSRLGQAGSILADATNLELSSGGTIATTSATSGGGNIVVRAQGNVLLDHGAVTASAQGVDAGDSGGNVSITRPAFLILDTGQIRADANAGRGGNITIDAVGFIASADSIISASSAQSVDGQVTNTSENTVGTIVDVEIPDVAPAEPIRTRCTAAQFQNRSSLVVRETRPGAVRSPYLSANSAPGDVSAASLPCGTEMAGL